MALIALISAEEFGANLNDNILPLVNEEEDFKFLANSEDYRTFDGTNNNLQHP